MIVLTFGNKMINDLVVSPKSPTILASASMDRSIRLWSLDPRNEEHPCCVIYGGDAHTEGVLSVVRMICYQCPPSSDNLGHTSHRQIFNFRRAWHKSQPRKTPIKATRGNQLTGPVGNTGEYRSATEVSQDFTEQTTNEESQLPSFF